ncbi:MAG: prepilin-type N-terminal cleavage/methylation domain-containing protein [Proteobacteria bacterium]|nr:prepilin-type N-terminal cleavage/methylation domain-containing protein [Pseudomonadota bacterium]
MKSDFSFAGKKGLDNRGFTLIEMAIVLIIIGIIIGAVVKGKDIIKSGEQKKLYTKFLNAWQQTYNNYYDRTGMVLGDVDDMDNGVTAGSGRDGFCDRASADNLDAQLKAVGLEVLPKGVTGKSTQVTYVDSTGRNNVIEIVFDSKKSPSRLGNFMRITGIPGDLAIAWDKVIDGVMNGKEGDFIYTADYTSADPTPDNFPSPETDPSGNAAAILKLSF